MNKISIIILIMSCNVALFAGRKDPYPQIVKAVRASKKGTPVIIFIRGTTWDRAGTSFTKRIWTNADFRQQAGAFTPVDISYPDKKPDEGKEYKPPVFIDKLPILIVADSNARPICIWKGIEEKTTIKEALAFVKRGRQALKTRNHFWDAPATGVKRAENLGKGLDAICDDTGKVDHAFNGSVDELEKMDPEDKTGYLLKYRQLDTHIKELFKKLSGLKSKAVLYEQYRILDKMLRNRRLMTLQKQKICAAKFAVTKALRNKNHLSEKEFNSRATADLLAISKLDADSTLGKAAAGLMKKLKEEAK